VLLTPVSSRARLALSDRDATYGGRLPDGKDALEEATHALCERAGELQEALYAESRQALLVVLQARDAGGKDGTARKVFSEMSPMGVRVTAFKAPSEEELAHDFLWRVHRAVPPFGIVGVFNRSHYEDVLVARVRGLVPKDVWSGRYAQINDFERMLAENRVTVVKFFLHISRKEQRERLLERLEDPRKNWKVSAGDWDDRERWADYTRAYRDALRKCSTRWAPWYVVPADDKKVRNYLVADAVVEVLERMRPKYPRADGKVLARLRREAR
jgi:PPK2 family polyphosphate:nucleotide phosphotransferase